MHPQRRARCEPSRQLSIDREIVVEPNQNSPHLTIEAILRRRSVWAFV
jgi:hypothetical protein